MAITAANLQVEVGASTRGAEAGLARVDRRMGRTRDKLNGLGKSMRRVGGRMTKIFTAGMAVAAGAAVKMAADFESEFAKIEGLVGVGGDSIAMFKDEVLGMVGDVAKSPQELAKALFFITSAGLEGDKALEALRASAKGSAAGLGETMSVANAVTNAINAYGGEVLNAQDATDVLTASVREGKAEASELGPQFGRVLPLATELGVSFDQLGGMMSFFTRTTGDAAKAGTWLEGILGAFIKPTEKGRKTLGQLGTSFDEVRAQIAEKGLLPALQGLRGRLDEADIGFGELIEDRGAITGVLQATGEQAGTAKDILGELADATGATQTAFEAAEQTTRHKFNAAMADAQAKLIQLGQNLMPAVTEILGTLTSWLERAANWWENLSPGMQKAVFIFAGLVAAAGPLLLILGGLVTLLAALISPVGLVVVGIGALVGALVVAYNTSETFRDTVQSVLEAVQRFWATWGDTVMRVVREVWAAVKTIFSGALSVIGGYVKLFVSLFTGDWQGMRDAVQQISQGLLRMLRGIFDALFGMLRGVVSSIRTMVVSIWQETWAAVRRTAASQAAQLVAFFSGLPGRIVSAMGNVNRLMVAAGKDLIRGLIRGVKDLAGSVADAVKDAIGGAVDAGKDLLGIGSPSKVMQGLGEDMNEGLMRGLRSDSERVHRQMLTTMQVPTVQNMAGGGEARTHERETIHERENITIVTADAQGAARSLSEENRDRAYLRGR